MRAISTIITIWDFVPETILVAATLMLIVTSLWTALPRRRVAVSKAYRLFVLILSPIIALTMYGVLSGRTAEVRTSRVFRAARESKLLESATFHYLREHDELMPVGGNRNVFEALLGHPDGPNFLSEDLVVGVNWRGEVVDPWGTPYRFEFIKDKRLDVVSAGPDRKFGTKDDVPEIK